MNIELKPLIEEEKEDFAIRNKRAFVEMITEEFGEQDFDPVSDEDVKRPLDHPDAKAYNIVCNNKIIGGILVRINNETNLNSLEAVFVETELRGKGIGAKVWDMIEKLYPETVTWETHTPYFNVSNIHFYVNKCGFHIVEFFNPAHPEPDDEDMPGGVMFFRFEKQMKKQK